MPVKETGFFCLTKHLYIVFFHRYCIVVLVARAARVDFPGAWYHVLNRGTERRAIFRSTRCYEKFIQLLSSLPERFGGKAARLRLEVTTTISNWRAERPT
jgi:hypothetical protein